MSDSDSVSFVDSSDGEGEGGQQRQQQRQQQQQQLNLGGVGVRQRRASDFTDSSESEDGSSAFLGRLSMPMAANSWQDVDREQLSGTVLKLISSVASTAPTDDKSRDAVWHPTTTLTATHNLDDPLGFGEIDVAALRLVRPGGREQQWQGAGGVPPGGPASMAAAAAAAQQQGNKGAVGRFFSELSRYGAAAAGSPTKRGKKPGQAAGPGPGSPGSRGGARDDGGGGRPGGRGRSHGGHGGGIPPSKLLPTEEAFDPELYLSVFHEASTVADLSSGLRTLERELGERTGQLKQLVKQNFDRFISCKTTIDDIYVKLRRIETKGAAISTEVLYSAIQEVQNGASEVFGPVLERSARAERIRSVQVLLRRFQGLFAAPQRIRSLAAARDYEQVTSEFKKANGLIKPGPKTSKVWASLYAEIEKRVAEVYGQLQEAVQDPSLPAAAASELVVHMLQLQAEGLAAARGHDPLALLLAAREQQFAAAMAAAAAEHERAVARLRASMAAASEGQLDPAAITETQLLQWRGDWDAGGGGLAAAAPAGGSAGGSPTAATAGAGAEVLRALDGLGGDAEAAAPPHDWAGQPGAAAAAAPQQQHHHLAEIAPLSGLRPPPPRSKLVLDTSCTVGEGLYLRHLQRQSTVLLECLPGFWQAAGASRLQLPANLPSAATAQLQQTMAGASGITERLSGSYCQAVGGLVAALAGVGPLREALLVAADELSYTVSQLEVHKAPAATLEGVRAVLGGCVAAGVRQLVGHLRTLPGWLVSREAWQLSLTHSGSQPITLMPEQLQEEVTVAMQYYQKLLGCSTGISTSSGGGAAASLAAAAAKIVSPESSTRPIRDAYFSCLEETVKEVKAAAQAMRPAGARGDRAAEQGGSPPRRAGAGAAAAGAAHGDAAAAGDDEDDEDAAAAGGAGLGLGLALGGAAAAASTAAALRMALSDDVRLLLLSSNLSFMRSKMVGSLTQCFLLALTGEVAAELDRCSRYVVKLAGRLDAAIQGVHAVYLERKARAVDRLLAAYVVPGGDAVGAPPELSDVTPLAQQLVQLAAAVQSESYTYARPFMHELLHASLEHMGGAIASAFSELPGGAGAGAAAAAQQQQQQQQGAGALGASCPVEALAQYFMDLVYLDAILSKSGPQSLSVDLAAAQQLIAARICRAGADGSGAGRERRGGGGGSETPLARSLLAVKDPQELARMLQLACRKALKGVVERSSFSVRSLMVKTAASTGVGGGGSHG